MSYIYELSKTVTLTSAGVGTAISTGHINGFISEIYIEGNKAAGATDLVTIAKSSAGNRTILKVGDPSTAGAYYHPRAIAVSSSGSAFNSSDGTQVVPFTMYKEKFKVTVAAGTSLIGTGTTTVYPTISVKVRWY